MVGTSLVVQWLGIACQCRRHGFEPWSGKIPHAAEPLSPCATTTEPVCHNDGRENLHATTREKSMRSNERSHMLQ